MIINKKARFEITKKRWQWFHFFTTNELKFQPSMHAIICTTRFKYQVREFCPIIQKEKDVEKKNMKRKGGDKNSWMIKKHHL